MNQLRHVAQHRQIVATPIMDAIVPQIVTVIVLVVAIVQPLKTAAANMISQKAFVFLADAFLLFVGENFLFQYFTGLVQKKDFVN